MIKEPCAQSAIGHLLVHENTYTLGIQFCSHPPTQFIVQLGMSSTDSKVLGVVVLVRHGDRQGFYQSPNTYTPSNTVITPLGNQQEFQLGQKLRSIYLNEQSPSFISGINTTLVDNSQIHVRADAGGEGVVILNSAQSLVQGLFPANQDYKVALTNGSIITGPLGGYQYVAIESVEPTNDVSLEGWTSCGTFNDATQAFYNSTAFKQKASENDAFLKSLPPFLDGRPVTMENMWNIYDFMNVQSIHNPKFKALLPSGFLDKARDLANFHEYGVFSDPNPAGIRNIAAHTILPSILAGFKSITDDKDPIKFVYEAISYKPFLSLFNLTGAAQANPALAEIVDYTGALVFEVRQPSSGGAPVLRFNFKNGEGDADFKTYNIFNTTGSDTDIPLAQFVDYMAPLVINSTAAWCSVCSNNQDRGCAALHLAATSNSNRSKPRISPVGAGFLGAGLTLAVALAILGALFFMGLLAVGRSKKRHSKAGSEDGSVEKI
ncbi:phosphoglycerate mutase-like protein [Collybia nuda]|uniref:Phosphoglycerate mutase-like protein n=1 Tax=Collybia nuda TaxID=64659 RepID=A0A9P5Y691_9AGAR|nr:phosphoglycerate mutase-like protein [Collybia nuda]